MREYIGANDIANQISMMRSVHDGPVILVEGVTDKRLYGKFVDPDVCEIAVGHSKDNVRIAVRELYFKRNDRNVIGIMDADLDRLTGSEPKPPLFLTDCRDSEVQLISSRAFDDVLWEYGEEEKIERFMKAHGDIRDAVLNGSYPLGLFMLVSLEKDFCLSFKDLDYGRFIDPNDLSADIRSMVDEVMYNSKNPGSNQKHIRNELVKKLDQEYERMDVCRGHDAVAVLLIGFKRIFGSYNARNLKCGELAGALRLAFDLDDFVETGLYRRTGEWCAKNGMTVWITDRGLPSRSRPPSP